MLLHIMNSVWGRMKYQTTWRERFTGNWWKLPVLQHGGETVVTTSQPSRRSNISVAVLQSVYPLIRLSPAAPPTQATLIVYCVCAGGSWIYPPTSYSCGRHFCLMRSRKALPSITIHQLLLCARLRIIVRTHFTSRLLTVDFSTFWSLSNVKVLIFDLVSEVRLEVQVQSPISAEVRVRTDSTQLWWMRLE